MTDRAFFDDLADPRGTDPEDRGRRDRKLLRWLLLAVVVVVGGLYLAGYAYSSDRLPRSTTVAGVDVGAMRPDRAEQVLRDKLAEPAAEPVRVQVGDRTVSLDPEEVGLDVDVQASIGQVPVGRSWDVADMWETLVGGEEYDVVVVAVDDLLEERLETLAAEVDQPPVEGSVRFARSGARPTYPRVGRVLDVPAAAAEVSAAYPFAERPVPLELVPQTPSVSASEVSRAMEEFANPAMSGPVTLVTSRSQLVMRPASYARALRVRADSGELVPDVDPQVLADLVGAAVGQVDEPRDARVRIVGGRPRVVPARSGVVIDRDELAEVFLDVVVDRGDRRARLPTRVVSPELTTAEVRRLGINEKVSQFTTYYPHADYRNVNIGRAAELINGTILEPGETFSLNDTVGERTRANGFTEGFIISDGVYAEDFGGGVSQVATTTYNTAFFAGLEDVEHKPHSFYIDRYPMGREATVAWPTVDLRFTNDTDHGVLIRTQHLTSTFARSGALTVQMWSTKVWDVSARTSAPYSYTSPETRYLSGADCVPNDGYSGFQVDVTRVFRRAGQDVVHHTEQFHTTYIPSDTVICR